MGTPTGQSECAIAVVKRIFDDPPLVHVSEIAPGDWLDIILRCLEILKPRAKDLHGFSPLVSWLNFTRYTSDPEKPEIRQTFNPNFQGTELGPESPCYHVAKVEHRRRGNIKTGSEIFLTRKAELVLWSYEYEIGKSGMERDKTCKFSTLYHGELLMMLFGHCDLGKKILESLNLLASQNLEKKRSGVFVAQRLADDFEDILARIDFSQSGC